MLKKQIKVSERTHSNLMLAKRLLGLNTIDEVLQSLFAYLRLMALSEQAKRADRFKETFYTGPLFHVGPDGELKAITEYKDGKVVKKTERVESSLTVTGKVLKEK